MSWLYLTVLIPALKLATYVLRLLLQLVATSFVLVILLYAFSVIVPTIPFMSDLWSTLHAHALTALFKNIADSIINLLNKF